jgi:signal transduction histidine kinase
VGASKIARDVTELKRGERERVRLLAREQESRRTAELLNRVGPMLAAQLDPDKLSQVVTDLGAALVGAEFGVFYRNVPGEQGESLAVHSVCGATEETLDALSPPLEAGLYSSLFDGGGVALHDDITRVVQIQVPLSLRSCLTAPVAARSGEVFGYMLFGHSEPGKFTASHEAIVTGVAAQSAIAMDNARLFEQSQWVQTELKRSNEELRRANQDLETFAYSASHDLQEPLRTIAICAQLLERSVAGKLPDDALEFLTSIVDGASRMTVLIQDLLAYTTATKSAEGPPPALDSGSVVQAVLAALHAAIEEAGARVTVGALPVVRMHETRLAQLFQNLLTNALKYRSEAPPRIDISALDQDGWCVFSVTDNGIGIEPRYAHQIFGLFKRLHSRQAYPGSGIGLAMCQRIVEQYGGRIWLEKSTPGEGSTFCFSIPAGGH